MDRVIKLVQQGEIGIVAMEDREYKNTFSQRFLKELKDTFKDISQNKTLKVIVVHGYDNYFCCGGTKDELIGLSKSVVLEEESEVTLEDLNFFDLFLRCEIPVIAAMQGHAIGGGLALGCFADILVLGEECIYNAVFMKYGFTPGMGATYIIPRKLGDALGNEMLFTARNYYGIEMKERGAMVKIVKKQNVIQSALDIATELAEKPLVSLKLLKAHLNRDIKNDISNVAAKENEMHKITFAQPEVRERIEILFGK
jgi:polyketide biosynthesis enoyl-CoA hydratase PksI